MPRWLTQLLALSFASASLASNPWIGPELAVSPPVTAPAPYGQQLMDLATNGQDFLALWLDRRSTIASLLPAPSAPSTYVTRIDDAGQPTNPYGTKLFDGYGAAQLIRTPAGYFVLWSAANGGVQWMPLSDDGTPLGQPAMLTDGFLTSAASNGQTICVIHGPLGGSREISLFSTEGALLANTPIGNSYRMPRPLMVPGGYAMITSMPVCPGNAPCPNIVLTTIADFGAVATQSLNSISSWTNVAAAVGNDRILVATVVDSQIAPQRTVDFQIFDLSGQPLTAIEQVEKTDHIPVIGGYGWQPSAGWDGSGFLVVWAWPDPNDATGTTGATHAVRVTGDGTLLDPTPIELSPALVDGPQFASAAGAQLVAWNVGINGGNLVARTAPTFATIGTATDHIIANAAALQSEAALTTFGNQTLAIWREGDAHPSIAAAFLGGPPITVAPAGMLDLQTPAAASNGQIALIVWREQRYDPYRQENGFRILARRMTRDGVVLDPDPIVIVSDQENELWMAAANALAVASDGTDFLVVWAAPGDFLRGARITSGGNVLDQTPIAVSTGAIGTPGSPRAIWNGSRYVVVWTSDPSCKICLSPPGPPVSILFFSRVASDGTLDGGAQQMWNGGGSNRVALTLDHDRFMLAWGVFDDWKRQEACVEAMPLHLDGTPIGSPHDVACTTSLTWPAQFPDVEITLAGGAPLVVWTDAGTNTATVEGQQLLVDGYPANPAPFEIAPQGTASFLPALSGSPAGATVVYDRIASEPQYGGVARLFTRQIVTQAPPRTRAIHH